MAVGFCLKFHIFPWEILPNSPIVVRIKFILILSMRWMFISMTWWLQIVTCSFLMRVLKIQHDYHRKMCAGIDGMPRRNILLCYSFAQRNSQLGSHFQHANQFLFLKYNMHSNIIFNFQYNNIYSPILFLCHSLPNMKIPISIDWI